MYIDDAKIHELNEKINILVRYRHCCESTRLAHIEKQYNYI